jgi:hypothetical protein
MLCGEERPGCGPGQGGALTAIPGAVLNSGLDGGIRAYSATDGRILWLYNALQDYITVNGVKAKGGSMDGNGPIVADGMVFVNSGYGGLIGTPGKRPAGLRPGLNPARPGLDAGLRCPERLPVRLDALAPVRGHRADRRPASRP